MLQVTVGGHENVEVLLRPRQQLPIAQLRPAKLERRADFMAAQMLAQRFGNSLVEENAH